MKNLRNDLVRLRNLSSEKTGNLRNSPVLEKTHRFLYSDTECNEQVASFLAPFGGEPGAYRDLALWPK